MNLFLIPFLVGCFGWLLVWGMFKFVFYPLQPIHLGPIKWESKADKWMNQLDITRWFPALTQNDHFDALKPLVNEKLDDFFRHKLSSKLPMISMFIGEKTIEELKAVFMEELELLFPALINSFSSNLNKDIQLKWQLNFKKIILSKVTRATIPIKWAAFGLGVIWGGLIVLILPLI